MGGFRISQLPPENNIQKQLGHCITWFSAYLSSKLTITRVHTWSRSQWAAVGDGYNWDAGLIISLPHNFKAGESCTSRLFITGGGGYWFPLVRQMEQCCGVVIVSQSAPVSLLCFSSCPACLLPMARVTPPCPRLSWAGFHCQHLFRWVSLFSSTATSSLYCTRSFFQTGKHLFFQMMSATVVQHFSPRLPILVCMELWVF